MVSPVSEDGIEYTEKEITEQENYLKQLIIWAKSQVISAIQTEPGLENTKIRQVRVDLSDESLPYHEGQLNALGYFALNYVDPKVLEDAYERTNVQESTKIYSTTCGYSTNIIDIPLVDSSSCVN